MALPIIFLIFIFLIFINWKVRSGPNENFAKDYWYTNKNPLQKTWWPAVIIVFYFLIVIVAGIYSGE